MTLVFIRVFGYFCIDKVRGIAPDFVYSLKEVQR